MLRTIFFSILFLFTTCLCQAQDRLVAYVRTDSCWNLIDSSGNILISRVFDGDSSFILINNEAMIGITQGGRYGYYDLISNTATSCIYDSITSFQSGLAAVKLENKYFLIDRTGKKQRDLQGLPLPAKEEEKGCKMIDKPYGYNCQTPDGRYLLSNNEAMVAPWNKPESFLQNRIVGLHYYLDKSCDCKKSYAYYGFMDTSGHFVIDAAFNFADNFHYGLAAVETTDGYGYIDMAGSWVIIPGYLDATRFFLIKNK